MVITRLKSDVRKESNLCPKAGYDTASFLVDLLISFWGLVFDIMNIFDVEPTENESRKRWCKVKSKELRICYFLNHS